MSDVRCPVAPGEAWSVGIDGDRAVLEIRYRSLMGSNPIRGLVRVRPPPEASLASVGKSESGSVDSGY